ncbi:extracellular solute-binding protein [Streptomyces aidingensis]|uniref:extracellular solute-binding protein n=1 Tax=Streptomyces aidingensis TaxID=910347 RepID=UPI001586F942|nr:extracellular solute-binding protein [Streptomyces aidingensis]
MRTAVAAVAAALLAGAACTGTRGDGDLTLTLLAADYGRRTALPISALWEELTTRFAVEHPGVEIEVELVPWERLDTVLAERVAAGKAPDIAQAASFESYAADGLLYRTKEILPLPVQSDFILSLAHAGELHYEQYGMPFVSSTPRLFYNTGLFARAGLDGPPESWRELREAAEALAAAGVPVPYALQFGADSVHEEAMVWLLAGGGGYTNITDNYVLDQRANTEALEWLRDNIVAPGLAGPRWRLDRGEAYGAFLAGRAGMVLAHPAVLAAMDESTVPYAHAAFPGRDGEAAVPTGHADWLLAFRGSGHGEAIGDFLAFVYRADNVELLSAKHGAVPPTESGSQAVLANPADRHLWEFVRQMPSAELQPVSKGSWLPLREKLRELLPGAVAPDGDPGAVLTALQIAAADLEADSG